MNKKLSTFESICILTMITINTILLSAPKIIVEQSGTGAFVNCIFIGIIVLIFILIFNKLIKSFPTCDILDISQFLGGRFLKTIIGICFIFILGLGICISLAQFSVLLKTVYFEKSPMLFILLFFIIGILICNLNGFGGVKKSLCFYFPISLLTLLIVLKSKVDAFSLIKITPIFGTSFENTFINGSSNIFIFTNILMLYLLLPYLEDNTNFKKITIWSFVISWVLITLTVIALLTSYPLANISSDINSVYILTRRIELTAFIQRSDGLFVFFWILSFLSYLSLMFYLITSIIKKIFNLENEKMLSYPIISIIIGLTNSVIRSNFYKFEGIEILKYVFIITIYVISFFILIFSTIKKKKYNYNSRSYEKN